MMKAPRLNDEDIEKAVRLLESWHGKLTWDRYLPVLAGQIGHTYTKMAMHKHPKVMVAWDAAKMRLQANGLGTIHGNQVIELAKRRISELEAKNERLELENHQLLEKFLRWSYNAKGRGMTPADLDKELPKFKSR